MEKSKHNLNPFGNIITKTLHPGDNENRIEFSEWFLINLQNNSV